jgi:hypothetical protein
MVRFAGKLRCCRAEEAQVGDGARYLDITRQRERLAAIA